MIDDDDNDDDDDDDDDDDGYDDKDDIDNDDPGSDWVGEGHFTSEGRTVPDDELEFATFLTPYYRRLGKVRMWATPYEKSPKKQMSTISAIISCHGPGYPVN